jgi:chemotaxis protein MotA
MFAIIGVIVVVVGVLAGYMIAGGPIGVLIQVSEFIVIGGAAGGSLLIATPAKVLKDLGGQLPKIFKGAKYTKESYTELLRMLYELFVTGKKGGMLSLEEHVNNPEGSSIFTKYPVFIHSHHAVSFLCDALKLMINSGLRPDEIELLMDSELEAHHEEAALPAGVLNKVADALPGLGIVAAVLGIIITMQAIDGPVEEIGHHVAAALVGTFLGVLMSYGFLQPLASNLEHMARDEGKYCQVIRTGLVTFAYGAAPIVAVEFARKIIYSADRPTNAEMEEAVKQKA